ncbi:hypothetical protein PTKIN_Ptkin18bG0148400 [Pterospermum kingtungense]
MDSDETMTRIPCGYKFVPTDDELLLYLSKKVRGEPLPSNAVTVCEIYGDEEPLKIFDKTSQKFYVFTKLKKKSKGRRIERKTGCGTWKNQRTDPIKDSQNNHVGFRKLFVFEVKGFGSNNDVNNGHWIMHEFSLLNSQKKNFLFFSSFLDRDRQDDQDQTSPVGPSRASIQPDPVTSISLITGTGSGTGYTVLVPDRLVSTNTRG